MSRAAGPPRGAVSAPLPALLAAAEVSSPARLTTQRDAGEQVLPRPDCGGCTRTAHEGVFSANMCEAERKAWGAASVPHALRPSLRVHAISIFYTMSGRTGVTGEQRPPRPLSLSSKVTPALNFSSAKTPFSDKGGSEIPTSIGCQTSPGPARSFLFFDKPDPGAFSAPVPWQGGAPRTGDASGSGDAGPCSRQLHRWLGRQSQGPVLRRPVLMSQRDEAHVCVSNAAAKA